MLIAGLEGFICDHCVEQAHSIMNEELSSKKTLSFDTADRMRNQMAAAGIMVTWFPFDGGHEIPAEVVTAMKDFLARL